jgi:SAM-dependent methyltransferase
MQIQENLSVWDKSYVWTQAGEEWSATWGSAEAQWFGCLYPRIHNFVPAPTILEIAPGHGRWTKYLKDLASQLLIVDIAPNCIEACRERFLGSSHISGFVNDGMHLDMVPDGSVDFAFSVDSLVHAESDVLESYVAEMSRKLAPEGVGFFHHSNLGEYAQQLDSGKMTGSHGRAPSMTAEKFAMYCAQFNLACIGQEIVNWGSEELTDCFSVFTRKGSRWDRPNLIHRNGGFMAEAAVLRSLSPLYCDAAWPEEAARRTLLSALDSVG